jgi:DNA-directed RNA polymerase subunit M/transcription elongation factor TFIIS
MATNAGTTSHSMNSSHPTTSHSMNSSHPTTSQSQPGTSSVQREASPSPSSSSPKCEEVKVVYTANEQRASDKYQYMSSMFVSLN